jgi:HTH-type transcriptional regulator/antitoxin HipB
VKVTTVRELQALVRAGRKGLALSQQVLAERAGVSRKWLSEFERGATTNVELPILLRVLAALDLQIDIHGRGEVPSAVRNARQTIDLDDLLDRYDGRAAE